MNLLYAYIGFVCNLIIAYLFLNKLNYEYIIYSITSNYFLSLLLSFICVYYTMIVINYIQYTKYNNAFLYSCLHKAIMIFTLNTAEVKIIILMLLLCVKIKKYIIVSAGLLYSINFMSMFFYELTLEHQNEYNTIAIYQNTIYMFFRHSHYIYFKYMSKRIFLMFFMIAGDNWILDTISDGKCMYDKLAYMGLFNSVSTLLYIVINYFTK